MARPESHVTGHESLADLTAYEAAGAIRDGRVSSEELVAACLARVEEVDERVQAWAFLDPGHAIAQARAFDAARRAGAPVGPLHGLPFGVKDIFDTADMPTEDGTELHAGRRPGEDATAVRMLRAAGAVVLGKTVTTELAVYAPGKTRNPHDPERTPGGSSSGSAAAVAAGMVPLAIGSQTNGSVIRPAAYCGVVGFKPTHGAIPRHRVLAQSRWLDHVGVFARTVTDAALAAESLLGDDEHDPDTRPRARPVLVGTALAEPPVEPRIALVRTPVWDQAEESTREAFGELAGALGLGEVELPAMFSQAHECHRTIMEADLALSFEREYATGRGKLSERLREMIERGQRVTAVEYNRALGARAALGAALAELLEDWDALVTPAVAGEAPRGLDSTGSPVFCTIWTLTGVPAVTLPLLAGPDGLPLGAQLVGARDDDARLLRTANWLCRRLGEESRAGEGTP